MVHGRAGMKLEALKFGIYLFIPITASLAFNEPNVQRWAADYFQFLKYPANPNTNLKEEFEELLKKREKEKEQREAYAEQMKKLQESAQRSRLDSAAEAVAMRQSSSWFSWRRLRKGSNKISSGDIGNEEIQR